MNMIELQKMPRLNKSEKATVGIPSIIVNEGHVQVWDGYTWEHDFTGEPMTQWKIDESGELVKPDPTPDFILDDIALVQ